MTFIAGQYTVTYDTIGEGTPNTIGQIESGFTIEHFQNKRLITGDNEGLTAQDAVFQGHEVFIEFVLMEYRDASDTTRPVFWPYHANFGTQGVVGRLDVASSIALQLILTVVAGTTAAVAAAPTSLTAPRAILAEGFPVRMSLAPDLRDIPIRMRLYPNSGRDFYTTT